MSVKLNPGQKHLLRLVAQGAGVDGWAQVSKPVFPLLAATPAELIELESVGDDGRGRARLTSGGADLIAAMEWL